MLSSPWPTRLRVAAVALGLGVGAAGRAAVVPEVVVKRVAGPAGVELRCEANPALAGGDRVLLTVGVRPWGWAVRGQEFEEPDLLRADAGALPPQEDAVRGWLVRRDLVAELLTEWPDEGALEAELDTAGPGARSAWVRAGSDWGIRVGESWWRRVGGQPVARYDVRWVGPGVCFCAMTPLASAVPLRQGQRVALWPTPGERRDGRATTAVAFIESRGHEPLVWVAAPLGAACPTETHLDFFHEDRYVGYGVVERRDDRFWYANLVARRRGDEFASFAPPVGELSVGDRVVVRTQADIDAGRLVMRVFELTPAGALLNAGENDGLRAGQRLTLYRAGSAAGTADVRRTQRSYAEIVAVAGDGGPPLELRVDDELRLTAPPAGWRCVGALDEVRGGDLFTARLSAEVALRQVLAVRDGERTIGVACVVTVDGLLAGGFVFACSLTAPPRSGQLLFAAASGGAGMP